MHTQLFKDHRHKFVLPRNDEGTYVIEEAFPLAQILGRVELYLPVSDRTVLIDRESDLAHLIAAFEMTGGGETVGPCIRDEFSKARLIKVWLAHIPSEEEIEAVWYTLPDDARKGLIHGVLETRIARGEIGAVVT
ncbi:MAG: hypothetical protein Q7R60_00195 [bacterium]|nr:hypothetical protein [bacterium]